MFADTALAARIESAEARLTRDSTASGFSRPVGAGVAGFLRAGSPVNKVIGAGLTEPIDEAALAEIETQYQVRGEPVRIELCTLALPENALCLSKRGYRLSGFENVLGRRIGKEPRPESGIEVVPAGPARLDEWKRLVVDAFAAPDETGVVADTFTREIIAQAVEDMAQTPGYERYLALRDSVPAGAASMRIDAGIALFTGAGTLAGHRRRGVQGALLAQRLFDAAARGAEIAVITTGGGTSSQANVMRKGFSLLYARAILILDGPA